MEDGDVDNIGRYWNKVRKWILRTTDLAQRERPKWCRDSNKEKVLYNINFKRKFYDGNREPSWYDMGSERSNYLNEVRDRFGKKNKWSWSEKSYQTKRDYCFFLFPMCHLFPSEVCTSFKKFASRYITSMKIAHIRLYGGNESLESSVRVILIHRMKLLAEIYCSCYANNTPK